MFLRPRMTRTGGHAGPYVWGGVTGVTNSDNPWLTAVQENTATRLVVAGSSYDAEQRFLVNENPLSVRTALGVGLGSAGCAGPVFAPDKYGSAMWIDQTSQAAHVRCALPTLTSGTEITIEGRTTAEPGEATRFICFFSTGSQRIYTSSGDPRLFYYDGSAAKAVTTSLTSFGVTAGEPWYFRVHINGTSVTGEASLDGVTWGASATLSCVSVDFTGKTLYSGHSGTTSPARFKFYGLTVRDGDETALKIAEFTPGMFVGGNRADGDTAVDAHGVTWTLERPAATTDMPRVMVGGTEQYISLPGVAGEYVSTPDTAANSITGDIDIRVRLAMPDLTPSPTRALVSKWVGSGNQRAVRFEWRSDQYLRLYWSTSGADFPSESSSLVVPATVGEPIWVRATLDVSTGDVNFYTSTTDTNDDTLAVWTQLGATQTGTATSIFDSTAPWEIGSNDLGAGQQLEANVYVAAIYDGIDGTLVERIDAAEANANATTWTSSTSGATVTLNKSTSAQYHATVVPPNTTIVQGDGVNDFAQVVGDDTITDFVPATGLTMIADLVVTTGSGSFGRVMSTGSSVQSGILRNSTFERIYGRATDGSNIVQIGDNADNITYNDRTMFVAAFGSSDHESFVDGVSDETAATAVTAFSSAAALTFFRDPAGGGLGAFDLYGVAVLGERTSGTEAAAYATEGLTR